MLESKIKELVQTAGQQTYEMDCTDRWLEYLQQCYIAIVAALNEISLDKSYQQDARYRAAAKSAIENFQFLVPIVVVASCLQCTKPSTLQLQPLPSMQAKLENLSILICKLSTSEYVYH